MIKTKHTKDYSCHVDGWNSEPITAKVLPRRIAIVGTGHRVAMFLDPLVSDYKDANALVGFCDQSQVRMNYHLQRIQKQYGASIIPCYAAEQFDEMLRREKPDLVIICTPDATHDDYVLRAVRAGCDVIVEKPITTDAIKSKALLWGLENARQKVRVTFNLRWAHGPSMIQKLLLEGILGRVVHVNMEYLLDTKHGADYFRRWHSDKSQSGGLLVHKSCHHFDLVNWWLDQVPESVFAYGGLHFYGEENAKRRGDMHLIGFDRYNGRNAQKDPFHISLSQDERLKSLYLNAEEETGYVRDRNVFRGGIDIEDSLSVLVRYPNGAVMNYNLSAFSPYEGMRVSIAGERGRLEYTYVYHRNRKSIDDGNMSTRLSFIPLFGEAQEISLPITNMGHGGGDSLLQKQIFSGNNEKDILRRDAGHEQGIYSAMTGIAANVSLEKHQPIRISDLLERAHPSVPFSKLK